MGPQEIPFLHFSDTLVLLYDVMGAVASLSPLGKSLKMFKSIFSDSFSKSRNKHISYILEMESLPIEIATIVSIESLSKYITKELAYKQILYYFITDSQKQESIQRKKAREAEGKGCFERIGQISLPGARGTHL